MAKYVSFANLKGGSGKSSMTLQAANWLSVKENKSVLIVDCDIAQKTCYSGWVVVDNPIYDVILFDPSSAKEGWEDLLNEVDAYDYVFFDIPGTIFQDGILTILKLMDAIIVTTMVSEKDLFSTAAFVEYLRSGGINDFKVLLNKLRAYRDITHQQALDEISSGLNGELSETLDVDVNFFFNNNINDEQAAIEKVMDVGLVHNKMDKYKPFFVELTDYINR